MFRNYKAGGKVVVLDWSKGGKFKVGEVLLLDQALHPFKTGERCNLKASLLNECFRSAYKNEYKLKAL